MIDKMKAIRTNILIFVSLSEQREGNLEYLEMLENTSCQTYLL